MRISCSYKYLFIYFFFKDFEIVGSNAKVLHRSQDFIRTLQQGYTNLRLLVAQRLNFVRWHVHISSINIACVSVHMHRAERTIYSEFHTSRPNWVFRLELAQCHPSGGLNLNVAPRFWGGKL